MNETSLIKVTRLPEITERLQMLKEKWEQQATDAQAMVCTEETVQAVKAARAAMRKEFDEAEKQRKAAKVAYMATWVNVETVYNDCVKNPFIMADMAYREKIEEIEDAQKARCEEACREYFAELCAVHGVEFLRYEQSGVRITLTEAKKKTPSGLFDKLNEFVSRVACDLDAIGTMDPSVSALVMVEYKKNGLNLARAEKTLHDAMNTYEQERKSAEERNEKKRLEAEAVAKVEAVAPVLAPPEVITPPVKKEEGWPLLTVTLKMTAKRDKIVKLREFMKSEGIKYERTTTAT